MNLETAPFEKLSAIYNKFFSIGFLNTSLENKLAVISLTCYLTNGLRKKGKWVTCYDVLLKIGNEFGDLEKNTFLKSLAVICEDLMYGCDTFPDFGIKVSEMPKNLKSLLGTYIPF